MERIDQEHFGRALCMASGGLFCDSEVLAAPVISGTSRFVKPSFSFLVSPFESSLSDVSGGLVADGVAVEVAATAMGEDFGNEHRDLSSW